MFRYHAPVDPDCPEVSNFAAGLFGDPMTEAMGAPTDELMAGFEAKHRVTCLRCQTFGVENIEVVN